MKKIYIDVGHGGSDSGAVGASGVLEKVLVLKVALLAEAALKRNGYTVLLSRREDSHESLTDRCREANEWGAEAVVSIHANAAVSTAKGTETWIVGKGGEAEKLAEAVQKELVRDLVTVDRGLKVGQLVILKKTEAPAILCELGFLTNPQECAFLEQESVQRRAAEAICRGICRYDGKAYKEVIRMAYKDEKDIPAWAKGAVERVTEAGLMLGHDDGTFKPNDPVTRAQMAVILDRLEMLGEE